MERQEVPENFGSSRSDRKQADLSTLLFISGIILITGVSASLPFSRMMQRVTMRRFHLLADSFPGWAIQQFVPVMYSFENRVWFDENGICGAVVSHNPTSSVGWDTDAIESDADTRQKKVPAVVNHFPLRLLTFGDYRFRLLGDGAPHHLLVRSRYRGAELISHIEAIPTSGGHYRLRRTLVTPETGFLEAERHASY